MSRYKEYKNPNVRINHINKFINEIDRLQNFLDLDCCRLQDDCYECRTQEECRQIGKIQEAFGEFRVIVKHNKEMWPDD